MLTKLNLVQKPTSDIIPMKSVNTSDQRFDYADSDSSLKMAKLIHGAIDFKQDGMNLGFSLLVEGKKGPAVQPLFIINDGNAYEKQWGGNKIALQQNNYFIKTDSVLPGLNDKWSLQSINSFISSPYYPHRIYEYIKKVLQGYLELPFSAHYGLITAWAIATYFAPLFPAFPFLLFFGPKETGKSKLLEILSQFAFNAYKVKSITEAALSDTTDGLRGTILFDQAEYLPKNTAGFLADSYKRAGAKRRIVAYNNGTRYIRETSGYGPKAFASTRELDVDLTDRCCLINMQRTTMRLPDLFGEEPGWNKIRDALYRFLLCKWTTVRDVFCSIQATGKRRGELWRPLQAVLMALEVPDGEICEIKTIFDNGIERTKDRLSPTEVALFQVLIERANDDDQFVMTTAELLQSMEDLLHKIDQPNVKSLGKTISLFDLADSRKKRTRAKIMHYNFSSARIFDKALRYLGNEFSTGNDKTEVNE
jgi:hypothetical protein